MRFSPEMLAFTDGDVWRLGIGDPTVMGWLTVAAYFGVALLCFRRALAFRPRPGQAGRLIFWSGLGALLILLGINKQLDLQTLLTLTARQMAIEQGWYENRRVVQLFFVGFVTLASAAGFFVMWNLVRGHGDELRIPLAGFVLLLFFVIARAASFHDVDELINLRIGGVRMNWIFELGAIAVIAWGAFRAKATSPDRWGLQRKATHA